MPPSLRELVRKAFTREITVQVGRRKKLRRAQVQPSENLVYGVCFRSFSNEIFAGITFVIGTILGAFFGARA